MVWWLQRESAARVVARAAFRAAARVETGCGGSLVPSQKNPSKRIRHATAREQRHKKNIVVGIMVPSSAVLRTVYIHLGIQIKYYEAIVSA